MENLSGLKWRADYANDRTWTGAQNFGNTVLYRMCDEKPRHNDIDAITGKLWLIGRAYSASPERGAGETPEGGADDFFQYLAEFDRDRWDQLDNRLDQFGEQNQFSERTLKQILESHWFFVELIADAIRPRLRAGREPRLHRSFASKYLHFHRPDHFPIYDSYVTAALKDKGKERVLSSLQGADADATYADFCARAVTSGDLPELTLRQFDQKLYDLRRQMLKEKKAKDTSAD